METSPSWRRKPVTPIDADLREQILKLGPYQPEGNFQKDAKERSFSSFYYSFISVRVQNEATCYREWLAPWNMECEDSPCGQKTQMDSGRKFSSPIGG
ncbi:hypothetical protein TNCV_1216041 [Trichonephila clavipes]|nr:hypothetical protein TNCV_1216041 [Trichonephila clavipes]